MFQGESYVVLDDKSRLTVPAKYRVFIKEEDLQKGFVLIHLPQENCLRMFTPSEWVTKIAGLRDIARQMPNPEQFMQVMMAHSETIDMDSQFRVLVPQRLLAYANLERGMELAMVGATNHIQIWNKERWRETAEKEQNQIQDKLKDIRGLMGGYGETGERH